MMYHGSLVSFMPTIILLLLSSFKEEQQTGHRATKKIPSPMKIRWISTCITLPYRGQGSSAYGPRGVRDGNEATTAFHSYAIEGALVTDVRLRTVFDPVNVGQCNSRLIQNLGLSLIGWVE
jgi:hypothetical protein